MDAAWSVAYCETRCDTGCATAGDDIPPLAPTPLHRSISVVAVQSLASVIPVVAVQRDFLQTAGLAAAPERLYELANQLGAAGVTRIAAVGSMSMPEAAWHHDGRFSLLDLVRMVEIEQSAELAAQPFAAYAD